MLNEKQKNMRIIITNQNFAWNKEMFQNLM